MMTASMSSYNANGVAKDDMVNAGHIGSRVIIGGEKLGTLRYFGVVDSKPGVFCGVELDEPEGKNDGTLNGRAYFCARALYGIFAPVHKVQLYSDAYESPQPEESLPHVMYRSQQPSSYSHRPQTVAEPAFTQLQSLPAQQQLSRDSVESVSGLDLLEFVLPPSDFVPSSALKKKDSFGIGSDTTIDDITREQPPSRLFSDSTSSLTSVEHDHESGEMANSLKLRRTSTKSSDGRLALDNLTDDNKAWYADDDTPMSEQPRGDVAVPITPLRIESDIKDNRVSDVNSVGVCSLTLDQPDDLSLTPVAQSSPISDVDNQQTPIAISTSGGTKRKHTDTKTAVPKSTTFTVTPAQIISTVGNTTITVTTPMVAAAETPTLTAEMAASDKSDGSNGDGRSPPRKRMQTTNALKSPAVQAASRPPKAPKGKTKNQLIMEKLQQSITEQKAKPKKEVKSKLAEMLSAPSPVREQPSTSADVTDSTTAKTPTDKENASSSIAGRSANQTPLSSPKRMPPVGGMKTAKVGGGNAPVRITKPRQSLLPPKGPPPMKKSTSKVADSNTNVIAATQNGTLPKTKMPPPSKLPLSRTNSRSSVASQRSDIAENMDTTKNVPSKTSSPVPQKLSSATTNGAKQSSNSTAISSNTSGRHTPRSRTAASKTTSAAPPSKSSASSTTKTSSAATAAHSQKLQMEKQEQLERQLEVGKRRLSDANNGFAAMAVVFSYSSDKLNAVDDNLSKVQKQLHESRSDIDKLKLELANSSKENVEQKHLFETRLEEVRQEHKQEKDELATKHAEDLRELKERLSKEKSVTIERLTEEHQQKLEKEKQVLEQLHKTEIGKLEDAKRLVEDEYELRLDEKDATIEKLKDNEHRLKESFHQDSNAKIQFLIKEQDSLKVELEVKTQRNQELAAENRKLQLEVDKIPQKDGEIRKLAIRCEEHQKNVQRADERAKAYLKNYEDLQKRFERQEVMSRSLREKNDELHFKLEESISCDEDHHFVGDTTQFFTPSAANDARLSLPSARRSRSSNSESHDLTAMTPQGAAAEVGAVRWRRSRLSTTISGSHKTPTVVEGEHENIPEIMTRSAISVVQEQGRRHRSRHLESDVDVIYTSQGMTTSLELTNDDDGGLNVQERRKLSFDDSEAPIDPVTCNAPSVVDSGMFSSVNSDTFGGAALTTTQTPTH